MTQTSAQELELATAKETAVVSAIEEDIIFGRLAPGTRLIEDSLMVRFGVTRHFIRQALAQLERTGIVIREKNKGVTVRSLSPLEVQKIYDVREFLQRQAALMIPLPAPATLIEKLKTIQTEYRRCVRDRDYGGVHELNDRFHLTLFSGCENPYLVESINHYMWLSLPVRAKTMANPDMLKISEQHHDVMIELLKGRDNWALAQLCVGHLQPSKNEYLGEIAKSLKLPPL
jgi:DNA-binding GntR family transcriptional regulator